jgi:hypothetical protein
MWSLHQIDCFKTKMLYPIFYIFRFSALLKSQDLSFKPFDIHHHPINVPTAGTQAFLIDYT